MKELLKNKKYRTMIGGAIVVVMLIVLLMNMSGNKQIEQGTSDNASKEEIVERLTQKVDPSVLAVSMSQSIEVAKGSKEAVLNIENLPENNYTISVDIRNDKEEILYSAKGIKPGEIIRKDKLTSSLEEGSYVCSATFIAYNEEGKEVKQASAQIEIVVK